MFSESFQNARPSAKFEVGKVLGLTFGAIGRDWLVFLVLAAVLVMVPTAAVTYLFRGANPLRIDSAYWWRALVVLVQSFTLTSLLYGAIAWTIWVREGGQKPDLAGAMRATFSVALGLIGVVFATTFAVYLGLILLIVPGIIAAVTFWVTSPSCAIEGLGVVAAMRRSAELTRGQRWRILLMILAISVLTYIPSLLLNAVFVIGGHIIPEGSLVAPIVSASLRTALAAVFTASASACTYIELRTIKEGVGADSVARVFA